MHKLSIFIFTLISTQALASFTIRGGGDSVVCYKDLASVPEITFQDGKKVVLLDDEAKKNITSVRLLDLYLAETKDEYQFKKYEGHNWKDLLDQRVAKIKEVSNLYELLAYAQNKLKGHDSYSDNLVDVHDGVFTEFMTLPKNCQLLQIAAQGAEVDKVPALFYNRFLTEYLAEKAPLHRAALELHELLRYVTLNAETDGPVQDTLKIINLVKYIFSQEFEEDDLSTVREQLLRKQVFHHAHNFWSRIYREKYRPKTNRSALLENIFPLPRVDEKTWKMKFLAPKNPKEFHLILNGTTGVDLPSEGEVHLNGKKVAELFKGKLRHPSNDQSLFFNIPVKYLKKGRANKVEIFADSTDSFFIDTVFVRSVCRKYCEMRNDINWIPDGIIHRTATGWDSHLLRKVHRRINDWIFGKGKN